MAKNNNLTDFLTDVADAIREKKGTTDLINPQDFSSEIASISTGGSGAVESKEYKDVNFFDYEGTILYSYSWNEALQLTEMPPLPSHDGLICQGWNWTYEELQEAGGFADIGAIYTTVDGKNHFFIQINESVGYEVALYLGNQTYSVIIEWGDNTEDTYNDVTNITCTHKYANAGEYIIKIKKIKGNVSLGTQAKPLFQNEIQNFNNARKLIKAHVVDMVASNCSFHSCVNLEFLTMTANCGIYYFRMAYNTKVKHFNFPLQPIEINNVGAFNTTSICPGGRINSSIWSIGRIVTIPLKCSYGGFGFDAHKYLEDIRGLDGKIKINTQYFFRGCNSLKLRYEWLDKTVTSIGTGCFTNCWSMDEFICPPLVSVINATAFQNCYSLRMCDFSLLTVVPSLVNANAFLNVPKDCEIRVPKALEEEWKAATNWSTYADYIVGY